MDKKVDWDEVRDGLISDYCSPRCPDAQEDYHCPDHNCPVWRTLIFCGDESLKDDYPVKEHQDG